MAEAMQVEVVAADRLVWSGEAEYVLARTAEGEIGVLANHTPVLSLMVPGVVEVTPTDGERWTAAVSGGFLSVAANRVSILSENAELASDIDVQQARADLDSAGDDEEHADERAWAEARVRAAERKG